VNARTRIAPRRRDGRQRRAHPLPQPRPHRAGGARAVPVRQADHAAGSREHAGAAHLLRLADRLCRHGRGARRGPRRRAPLGRGVRGSDNFGAGARDAAPRARPRRRGRLLRGVEARPPGHAARAGGAGPRAPGLRARSLPRRGTRL
ncbi:MAG: Flagellum biosynthesis repressor protein FlbT, partial [uncultured Acetobacteraceae bacterium]